MSGQIARLIWLALAFASPAAAVDTLRVTTPDPILEPWRWTAFDRSSGLAGGIWDITEDRDGNLWLATSNGAQRYDGTHWTTYTTEDGLASNDVRSIVQTRDGAMWFGTSGGKGISRFDGETWTTYTTDDGLASNYVRFRGALHQARDGTLWAGAGRVDTTTTRLRISRFDGKAWTAVETPEGPSSSRVIQDIHEAADGSLWFSTGGHGVFRLHGASWTQYMAGEGLAGDNVWEILESRDGSLWFACRQNGISRFDGKQWRTYTVRDGLSEGVNFISLWQTADGTVWAGGRGRLCRFEGERWHTYTREEVPHLGGYFIAQPAQDGVIWFGEVTHARLLRFNPGATGWRVYSDMPPVVSTFYAADVLFTIGNEVWLGAPDGTVRFDGKTWIKYTADDGLIDGLVTTVLKAGDGSLWVAGQHRGKSGTARYDGKTWRLFSVEDGLIGQNIYTGYAAEDGGIWFGTKGGRGTSFGGTGAMRYDGASWTVYTIEDGLIHNTIYGITQTPDGAMWFGTLGGLSRFDGTEWTGYTLTEAENERKVRTLTVARDGSLWLGQAHPSRGATRYDGTAWTRYTLEDGLGDDAVWKVFQSRDGTFWFGTADILTRFDGSDWSIYSGEDMPVPIGTIRSIGETPDGALWLRGGGVLVRFVPDRHAPETVLEPAIEQVSSTGNILLRWSGRDLWDNTPPERMRYQWRLNGGPWSPPERRNGHTFTSLSDGRYEFEVRAVDRDMNVDATPPVHAFMVEPPWWKNPYLLGLAMLLLGSATVQTARLIRRDRSLRDANAALSMANKDLFQANRELHQERAAERVRGQVQSMEQASDFEGVLSLLAEDLKSVGLSFDTCGIDVLDEPVDEPSIPYFEEHGFRYTTYTIDPEGRVTHNAYHLSAPFPEVNQETIERFTAGEPWQGRSGETAMVEVPASNYGRLRITASDRERFTEEDIDALREFASAIALGYARYLDFRQIQEATERKSLFLASMSHELRTPMNAIIGFTRMVLRRTNDILPEQQKENLEKVTHSANHLLTLINELLDLSKIEAGRMDVNAERFDVKELIATCCTSVTPLVKPTVELKHEIANGVGEANTDAGRLRQIVMNLLSNALKFTEAGKVTVRVSKDRQPEGNGSLMIAVSDTGSGIPADALETIFEEFQQVKGSDPQHKGTGLGLPITKGFAELLGGTINVESEVGKGSTFTVRMPAVYKEDR